MCVGAAWRVQRRLLVEEIDLEIALRRRLLETTQSRITWALLLQEALEKELKGASNPAFGLKYIDKMFFSPRFPEL